MNIFHIISSLDKGGAESQVYELIKVQIKNKKKISVIYFRGNDYWASYLKKVGAAVYKINIKNNFSILSIIASVFKIRSLLKKNNTKIVHAHLTLPEILTVLIKIFFLREIKIVITKHLDSFAFESSRGQNKAFSGLFLEKILFYYADALIFITKNVKNYFKKKINLKNVFHKVIYYGFLIEEKKINLKKYVKLKSQKIFYKKNPIILNIARHVKQKRIEQILYSFKIILKKYPNALLIQIGNGPETNRLKQICNKLKINKNVKWVHYTTNIFEYFKLSNIFCLTSDYEGLGLVVLEAYAAGVPVVASNKSALPEIILNSKTGLLADNENSHEIAKCIIKIYSNHELKNTIVKNAKKFLIQKFNIFLMEKKIEHIYKKL